jgi:hypothetical protein
MTARAAVAAVLGGALAAGLIGAGGAAPERRHRLNLPEPDLPRALAVDEAEWSVRPSRTLVAAGLVRLRIYNRGEDDHNLVVVDRTGRPHVAFLRPRESATLSVRLAPGRVRLLCTLFAGTADSHELRGMRAEIRVR